MAKPIHSMIRVLEEARSVAFYSAAMGLEIVDRYGFDSFTLIYMRDPAATFELELTVNHGRAEPYQLGDGYGHLAVAVDDLEAQHERMSAAGAAPGAIKTIEHGGTLLGRFFFVKDPDGYSIEVLQHHGRFG
ncbi:MAG: VOC family protein [Acetobacteraceae bacterium]